MARRQAGAQVNPAPWQVIQGDALEALRGMEAGSVDCVIADPPYNIGYSYDVYRDDLPQDEYRAYMLSIIEATTEILKTGGSLWWLQYPEESSYMWQAVQETIPALRPVRMVAWVYHAHASGSPLRRAFRLWCWFSKGQAHLYGDFPGSYRNPNDSRVARLIESGGCPADYDWWELEQVKNVSEEKTDHPCQIPVEMVRRIVRTCCPSGGCVVDPFTGSGTTGAAAIMEGRRFVGIELSPEYCHMAERRLNSAQPPLPEVTV